MRSWGGGGCEHPPVILSSSKLREISVAAGQTGVSL